MENGIVIEERGLIALEEVIQEWKNAMTTQDISKIILGDARRPLCDLYRIGKLKKQECFNCPIMEHTRKKWCDGIHFFETAGALRSLQKLPDGEYMQLHFVSMATKALSELKDIFERYSDSSTLTSEQIIDLWERVKEDFPSKSTELLMAIACNYALNEFDVEIDNGDIATALEGKW